MTDLSIWLLVVLAFGLGKAFVYGQFVLVPRARRLEDSGGGGGKSTRHAKGRHPK